MRKRKNESWEIAWEGGRIVREWEKGFRMRKVVAEGENGCILNA
jgi:hypothetical protein